VIVQLAVSGQFHSSKHSNINEIAKYLKQIGVNDDDLQQVLGNLEAHSLPPRLRLDLPGAK